ncbi:Cytochrome c oxidase subunit 2 [Candidatus Brocadiaceae bacterium]|nr:Cytochrome c oxidase subunit 2 [Candidatus Brocadiaceae bacterium]
MKYRILLFALLIFSGCATVKKDTSLEFMPLDAPVQKIYMTAKQFEFEPKEVLVKQNTHVVLEIESLDVTHGFKIDQYGINVTIPEKSKITIEFYTREIGTYPFRCSHFCGMGHIGMRGKIIVE